MPRPRRSASLWLAPVFGLAVVGTALMPRDGGLVGLGVVVALLVVGLLASFGRA